MNLKLNEDLAERSDVQRWRHVVSVFPTSVLKTKRKGSHEQESFELDSYSHIFTHYLFLIILQYFAYILLKYFR